MVNKEEMNLSDELLKRKTFSIPSVQKELGIGYKELRNCVRELEKNGQATLSDDGLNYIVDNSRLVAQQLNQDAKSSAKRPSQFIQPYGKSEKDDDDDEKSPFAEMIARRRRELMERFAELNDDDDDDDDEEDEEDEEDDDDDDEDDDVACARKEIMRRRREQYERLVRLEKETPNDDEDDYNKLTIKGLEELQRELAEHLAHFNDVNNGANDDKDDAEDSDKKAYELLKSVSDRLDEYISEANDCKLIDGIDYTDDVEYAKKITNRLGDLGYKVKLKAIQYGKATTRYVFDYPVQNQDIRAAHLLVSVIKRAISANDVKIVAPWCGDTVCITAYHAEKFDPLSKSALKYWILRNGGRASIASIHRGLGIEFNRAGAIMEHLQKIGCVDQLSPSDNVSQPLSVKISLREIDILFPKSLGWE